jgi:hypothetical protein
VQGRIRSGQGKKHLITQGAGHDLARIHVNFHYWNRVAPLVQALSHRHSLAKILAVLNPVQMDTEICELAFVEMSIGQQRIHRADDFIRARRGLLGLKMIHLQDHGNRV